MRIKKVSQTTSTQAQVVDGYSTSTTDSYSCNYVNSMNTYSTNEIRRTEICSSFNFKERGNYGTRNIDDNF